MQHSRAPGSLPDLWAPVICTSFPAVLKALNEVTGFNLILNIPKLL